MQKRRVIVLTDISSLKSGYLEPDDAQSMVRFLLYSNEFDIEGLIATAYGSHGAHPELINELIAGYEKAYPNLIKHADGFPTARNLSEKVGCGSALTGVERIGKYRASQGSDMIASALKKPDARPLWVLIWGGALDLGQTIWQIAHTHTSEIANELLGKLRVYSIGDQYDECGPWIRMSFPQVFYITNYSAFRGMYRGGDESLVCSDWVRKYVRNPENPLGMLYPDYDGSDPWGKVFGIKEGDTPSFLSLLPGSPSGPETPEQCGWGGQFVRTGAMHYDDSKIANAADTVSRWRKQYQCDFAKRLQWCIC